MISRIQTTLRINPDLYEKLKKEAEEKGVSVNALISIRLVQQNKKGEKG